MVKIGGQMLETVEGSLCFVPCMIKEVRLKQGLIFSLCTTDIGCMLDSEMGGWFAGI